MLLIIILNLAILPSGDMLEKLWFQKWECQILSPIHLVAIPANLSFYKILIQHSSLKPAVATPVA